MVLPNRILQLSNDLASQAKVLGKTIEVHAATHIVQTNINWQRVCAVAIAIAFVAGAFTGYTLHA